MWECEEKYVAERLSVKGRYQHVDNIDGADAFNEAKGKNNTLLEVFETMNSSYVVNPILSNSHRSALRGGSAYMRSECWKLHVCF
ncbi:hypothetical protein E2C01_098749 [Portunus trituberculatus]|uniref:Uncharacterized protein n=1 Tax=Portunus trituberculatus TaxID=210409 RepID=A0A5B7K8H2_PORTR|nr:hypothetical protein [Portunus trituberculatus]